MCRLWLRLPHLLPPAKSRCSGDCIEQMFSTGYDPIPWPPRRSNVWSSPYCSPCCVEGHAYVPPVTRLSCGQCSSYRIWSQRVGEFSDSAPRKDNLPIVVIEPSPPKLLCLTVRGDFFPTSPMGYAKYVCPDRNAPTCIEQFSLTGTGQQKQRHNIFELWIITLFNLRI